MVLCNFSALLFLSQFIFAHFTITLSCQVDPIPETIAMDLSRFVTVARELSAVVFSAATILVLQTGVGPTVQHDSFANKVVSCSGICLLIC